MITIKHLRFWLISNKIAKLRNFDKIEAEKEGKMPNGLLNNTREIYGILI